ncbi:MAG TPA: threonyl-tRNA synthetase editing domain-containing protein [Anaerolineae bacterium]|nr:threonyl-tRNA synthetase editing domain-containing protein [Anaerolineae bacterium]
MKLLTFQAKRFWWRSFSKTLEDAEDVAVEQEVFDAVVAFYQIEAIDATNRASIFRQTLKHLKWLANKREMRTIVLHSFTHLGGDNAEPDFARGLIEELAARLRETGYEIWITPFGYFNEWDLSVYGESLAKVWKQI